MEKENHKLFCSKRFQSTLYGAKEDNLNCAILENIIIPMISEYSIPFHYNFNGS